MSTKIPGQGSFFYKSNWTPEIDNLLLNVIIRLKDDYKVSGNVLPIHFFEQASNEIAENVSVRFSWSELYQRFQSFEQRFIVFKEVVDTDGVSWNVNFNTMAAASPVWNAVLKKNSMAAAYYYNGEPEFNLLSTLFGHPEIKTETKTEVILISDSRKSVKDGGGRLHTRGKAKKTSSAEGSDSVCSPVMPGGTRRKLFIEEGDNVVKDSRNEPRRQYNDSGPDGDLIRRLENAYPPRPMKPRCDHKASPHGSSCGSSSPATWWKHYGQ